MMSQVAPLDEPETLKQPASEIEDPLVPTHVKNVTDTSAVLNANGESIIPTRVGDSEDVTAGLFAANALQDLDAEDLESDDEGEHGEEWDDDDESAYEVALEGLSDQRLREGTGMVNLVSVAFCLPRLPICYSHHSPYDTLFCTRVLGGECLSDTLTRFYNSSGCMYI